MLTSLLTFAGGVLFGSIATMWLLQWSINRDPLGFCDEVLKNTKLKAHDESAEENFRRFWYGQRNPKT